MNKGYLFFLPILFFTLTVTANAATIYVDSSSGNDSTGDGTSGLPYKTFHKAYTESVADDTIDLTGTFTWTNADETGDTTNGYVLSKDLTIQGQGADQTIVQAASSDNTADRRVFQVSVGNTVTFKGLTIRYGKTSADGAGIEFLGSGVIDSCDLSYNRSTDGSGGGATVRGSLLVQNSTIHHNVAHYKGGGLERSYYSPSNGVPSSSDTLDIVNSTITNNTVTQSVAYLEGGGVFYRRGGGTITNSVISYNQIINGGSTHGLGTGDAASVVYLKNTIVAGNILGSNGGDIGHRSTSNGTYIDNGGNIIGRYGYYNTFTAGATSWLDSTYGVAVDGTYLLKDGGSTTGSLYLDTNLALNSSEVGTMTLAVTNESSIVVNNGQTGSNQSISVPSLDQRGASRNGALDIGSYEYGGTLGDDVDPSVSITNPEEDEYVSDSISLSANASDNVSVSSVQFYIDDAAEGSADTESPYSISWDSVGVDDGVHTVFAVATDSSGNTATSTEVSFNVLNSDTVFSNISVTEGSNSTSLSWDTSIENSTKVNYGLTDSLGSSTTESDTSTRVTSHSSEISGLDSCTTYYYQLEGIDNVLNVSNSSTYTFTTTGCQSISSSGSTSRVSQNDIRETNKNKTDTKTFSEDYLVNLIINLLRDNGLIDIDSNEDDKQLEENFIFRKNLRPQMEDPDVIQLQRFLNNNGFIVSNSGLGSPGNETNYFGTKTQNALIDFQNYYSKDILLPAGLEKGTGIFGEITRNFVNNF